MKASATDSEKTRTLKDEGCGTRWFQLENDCEDFFVEIVREFAQRPAIFAEQ